MMLRITGLIVLTLLVLALRPAAAQPASASDFFHEAGQAYIAGDLAQASAAVAEGLRLHPADARLQALQRKIDEEQQVQQNQQQGGRQPNEQGNENPGEEGARAPESEQQPGEPSDEGQEQQQTPGSGEEQPPQDPDRHIADGEAAGDASRLNRQEAEQILQALQDDEEQLLRKAKRMKAYPRRVEKDW